MPPMYYIRKSVMRISQAEMAALAKTTQGSVSKWENGEMEPDREQLARIRAEIHRRRLDWQDRWFFEAPAEAAS